LLYTKDSTIKELRASKKLVTQELEAARLTIKALEDDHVVLKAMHDKAVRAGRILMRRPGVVVPDDIVADVMAVLTPQATHLPLLLQQKMPPAGILQCDDLPERHLFIELASFREKV
jgi:hypothetical protein